MTPLSAIPLKSLFVDVSDQDSKFTVVDARMDETQTAAVLFGLVGGAVNSASNAASDNKKADRFRQASADIDLKSILLETANETLASHGDPPLADDRAHASHTLEIAIHDWGLQRTSHENQQMRVFLKLSLKIVDAKNRVVWEKKHENAVGDDTAELEAFTPDRLKTDMEALAQKSGKFIANEIIYR
ncbi:MAG TPA: hypothetical protein VNH64_11020 [Parvularculaceae bacterium]|nr:hypothetical protein [Parvularculaceae bacterium]